MINTTTASPLGVALSGRERYRCHDANLIDLALNRTQGNIIITESYFQTESTQKLSSTMNYDAYDTSQSSLYTGPDDPAVTINRGEYCFFLVWFFIFSSPFSGSLRIGKAGNLQNSFGICFIF